jgi:S-adenosylmethionine hydrolase
MPPPIITLTTDFGLSDPYVAALKGVILSVNPQATIVDICHDIRPQRIEQAAFVLASAWPYFPPGAIHVAVVDPGVGTGRRAVALATGAGTFLGPDNGVLSAALPDEARAHLSEAASGGPSPVPVPPGTVAHELTDPRFQRSPVSATFHGRDIFAPVAAHLSLGLTLPELGPPLASMLTLPPFRAALQPDGSLSSRVLHIDRFGNLITDVRQEDLPAGPIVVEVAGRRIEGLRPTYGPGQDLIAYIGSSGYLEIALVGSNASHTLGVGIGTPILVHLSG